MTDEEIDKWVESHIHYPENSDIAPAVIKWGKIVAHKFYNLGKEEGKKVVDYTAAFEGRWKENPILKPKCKNCSYFIDLSPDEGACSKPMGGRNGVWGDEEICDEFELDEYDNR